MKQRDARLAALAAGEDLSPAGQRKFEAVAAADPETDRLARELRAQREAMLTVRERADDTPTAGHTLRALRERIDAHQPAGAAPWRWVFVPAGFALAALALAGLLAWQMREREVVSPPPAIAVNLPSPPLPAHGAARAALPQRARGRTEDNRPVVRRPKRRSPREEAPGPTPGFLETALSRVDEILPQQDGTYRLRLRTDNPNVVVYLIQGEPKESDEGGE